MHKYTLVFLMLLVSVSGFPQIDRGPYLQMVGEETATLKWRTAVFMESKVYYGPSPYSLSFSAEVAGTFLDHEVRIEGLEAGRRYYYALANSSGFITPPGWDFYFETAPPAGTREPMRIWLIGDSGTGNADARAVRDAYRDFHSGHTDLWLMLGDNAYLEGTDLQYQNAVFEGMYEEFLINTALWSCPGNHDLRSYILSGATAPYFDIFSFPVAGELGGLASGTEHYYSFDYGNVHFVMLDSEESDRTPGGAMLNWLRSDLALNEQDWTVVCFHHPVYSKGSHDSDAELKQIEMRSYTLPILDSAGVDLVFSGHSHAYERSFLLNGHYGLSSSFSPTMLVDGGDGNPTGDGRYEKAISGPMVGKGSVYVTAGSSGSIEMLGTLDHPANHMGAFTLGSVVLDVNGLDLAVRFLDDNGNTGDYFEISKNDPTALPVVSLNAPAGIAQPGPITLVAIASDPDGVVAKVEFRVDNQVIGVDTLAPFEQVFAPLKAGVFELQAIVWDDDGNKAFSDKEELMVGMRRERGPAELTD